MGHKYFTLLRLCVGVLYSGLCSGPNTPSGWAQWSVWSMSHAGTLAAWLQLCCVDQLYAKPHYNCAICSVGTGRNSRLWSWNAWDRSWHKAVGFSNKALPPMEVCWVVMHMFTHNKYHFWTAAIRLHIDDHCFTCLQGMKTQCKLDVLVKMQGVLCNMFVSYCCSIYGSKLEDSVFAQISYITFGFLISWQCMRNRMLTPLLSGKEQSHGLIAVQSMYDNVFQKMGMLMIYTVATGAVLVWTQRWKSCKHTFVLGCSDGLQLWHYLGYCGQPQFIDDQYIYSRYQTSRWAPALQYVRLWNSFCTNITTKYNACHNIHVHQLWQYLGRLDRDSSETAVN